MPVLGRQPSGRAARRAAANERILSATAELLAEGAGFGDLSVEQITSRAGLRRTAFYDHFDDKRELLITLAKTRIVPIFAMSRPPVGDPVARDAIRARIEGGMRFAREHPGLFRAAVEASAYDDVVAAFWHEEIVERFVHGAEVMVRREQEAGLAPPIHPQAAARALIHMVLSSLYHHVAVDGPPAAEGSISDDELVDTLVTASIRILYGTES
jgi:AcrR family transcriptional regulator